MIGPRDRSASAAPAASRQSAAAFVADADAGRRPPGRLVICIQRTVRGRWKVLGVGRRETIVCQTLDDARRVAYLAVAHAHPCELIVRDAHHRVVRRELIAGREGSALTYADGDPSHDGAVRSWCPTTHRAEHTGQPSIREANDAGAGSLELVRRALKAARTA
jgi:hypothetical protein